MRAFFKFAAAVGVGLIACNALAASGDLYEADFGSGTIYKFAPNGTASVFASGLVSPSALAFDASANLFVADFGTGSIYKFASDGSRITFASGLDGPFGLAFDAAGNLFEADRSGAIFKFSRAGTKSTFASGLGRPAGLAFDPLGNLFEADFASGNIFKFTGAGAKSTFASGLTSPSAITIDKSGMLFGGDPRGGTVYSFTTEGVKSTYASGFLQPTGLAFDRATNLFVSDNAAGTISRIAPDGTKTVFATGLTNPQNLAFEPATAVPRNISTRAEVQTGDNVLIAGFIISGTDAKNVVIRAIGPSLSKSGVASPLPDPTLGLHNSSSVLVSNDDWQNASNASEIPPALQPSDPRESAILITLQPGAYTAIDQGKEGATGVSLVEVYDLDEGGASMLTNISTRAFVDAGEKVLIGGFIIAGGNGSADVIVRAIGPSLSQNGVSGALPDPTLELHDSNGTLLRSNDNWRDNQPAAIEATGLAPANELESAILATLPAGPYTAIVAGKGGNGGVALVEVYNVR